MAVSSSTCELSLRTNASNGSLEFLVEGCWLTDADDLPARAARGNEAWEAANVRGVR